jgi:hypothetical protein
MQLVKPSPLLRWHELGGVDKTQEVELVGQVTDAAFFSFTNARQAAHS